LTHLSFIPFYWCADFTIRTKIGDEQIEKEPSIIEERLIKIHGAVRLYEKY